MKGQAVLGLALASVVEARRRDVSMAEPFLHFAMSASFDSAFVAAVARIECTQAPIASALTPVLFAYLMTMLR
jgi:hypothetical protein